MTGKALLFAIMAGSAAAPLAAEVKTASATGFESVNKVVVRTSPDQTYAMLGRIGEWWSPSHSYSGKSANLSLGLKAGDCFCERLDGGGSVEHLRVVFAQPGKMLRLSGGLGPLQAEAVAATLSWQLKPVAGGTEVTQTYLVSGHIRAGAEKFAPAVDQVLAEQLKRLQARLAAE